MNEFGEPNMGNPSVRFDEGRSGNVVLTTTVCSNRLFPTPPTLPIFFIPIIPLAMHRMGWSKFHSSGLSDLPDVPCADLTRLKLI